MIPSDTALWSSSERPPPSVDGSRYRDPQPHIRQSSGNLTEGGWRIVGTKCRVLCVVCASQRKKVTLRWILGSLIDWTLNSYSKACLLMVTQSCFLGKQIPHTKVPNLIHVVFFLKESITFYHFVPYCAMFAHSTTLLLIVHCLHTNQFIPYYALFAHPSTLFLIVHYFHTQPPYSLLCTVRSTQ